YAEHEVLRMEWFADDAGRSKKTLGALAADRRRRKFGRQNTGLAAAFASEGIGIAGIDDQSARVAALDLCATPLNRCRGAFRAGKHAGNAGWRLEHRQHHIGPVAIANAGLGRGQPHAGNGRQVGVAFWSKRRNGRGHGGHSRARATLASPESIIPASAVSLEYLDYGFRHSLGWAGMTLFCA